jgi:putative SOS response-associated peptidase YedK
MNCIPNRRRWRWPWRAVPVADARAVQHCAVQDVPIIRRNAAGERELVQVRWGLVPRWAKDPSDPATTRSRAIGNTGRQAVFSNRLKYHRCLPADGFYEWTQTASGAKQPLHVGMRTRRPSLATLVRAVALPQASSTHTIITTLANAACAAP